MVQIGSSRSEWRGRVTGGQPSRVGLTVTKFQSQLRVCLPGAVITSAKRKRTRSEIKKDATASEFHLTNVLQSQMWRIHTNGPMRNTRTARMGMLFQFAKTFFFR
jgi:hypothetical protein